jgi:hypothetical protein
VDWAYVVIVLLVLACAGLGGRTVQLRRSLADKERALAARPVMPTPRPVTVAPPVIVTPPPAAPSPPEKKPEPLPPQRELPPERLTALANPQALPDAPDSLPDSTIDGARLGRMVVRAAAVRGELGRLDAVVRHQVAWVGLLNRFDPPVLLSCVAAGLPDGEFSQLGAVQACRTLQTRLAERSTAIAIDAAWKDSDRGISTAGSELRKLLRGALVSVGMSLTLVAKERVRESDAVATGLTFLLSRLGDPSGPGGQDRRRHLVAGVGGGVLLRLSPRGEWSTEFEDAAQSSATLPDQVDELNWRTVDTGPGDVLVLCSPTTAAFFARDQVRSDVTVGWHESPPDLVRFFWQLNQADQIQRDDRAAVAIWELDGNPDA